MVRCDKARSTKNKGKSEDKEEFQAIERFLSRLLYRRELNGFEGLDLQKLEITPSALTEHAFAG